MSKFTPGPWYPVWNNHYWQIKDENAKYSGEEAASVFVNETTKERAEANARLIAAAPDLLNSVFELTRLLELYLQINPYAVHDADSPRGRAYAAVEKAIGVRE